VEENRVQGVEDPRIPGFEGSSEEKAGAEDSTEIRQYLC